MTSGEACEHEWGAESSPWATVVTPSTSASAAALWPTTRMP